MWVIGDGVLIEKGGVNFFYVFGDSLLFLVSVYWLELVGCGFQVFGVLLVIYLENFYVLMFYVNVCFFCVEKEGEELVWWFGGGFDLIFYYVYEEDCVYWYWVVCDVCVLFGVDVYLCYKEWCDCYFYFKYCNELCGIGGLFFDDFNQWDFDICFVFICVIGDVYIDVYLLIVQCCKYMLFDEWQ